jgi:hypothetical protein
MPFHTRVFLSVHPGSCSLLTELSDHQADGGPAQEGEGAAVEALPVLGQPATAVEPGDGAFDNPAPGQDDEPLCRIGALDDRDADLAADAAQSVLELRSLVAAVGIELEQERMQAEQRAHQQHAAVAVLEVGGMHEGMEQQTLRIDEEVTLLALDLLARIKARRIDAALPFSAPLTLWLSMIATVGLASRPACSRHWT